MAKPLSPAAADLLQQYMEHVRHLPCASCGERPPSEFAHVKARGSRHRSAHLGNAIPLCTGCHRAQHQGVKVLPPGEADRLAVAILQAWLSRRPAPLPF